MIGWARTSILLTACLFLSGCISTIWSSANLIYDRHNVYKHANDFELAAKTNRAVYKDKALKCRYCVIDLTVFNGDILLAGHVPKPELRETAQARVASVVGFRRIFNQLAIRKSVSNGLEDSWITAKIRARILADANINPKAFKVATVDNIVYLMGDVVYSQASLVIQIARRTSGVKRVVKLFKYYHLNDKAGI